MVKRPTRRRTPRIKRRPWRVGLSAEEWAMLTTRARAHGVTRPDLVRSLIMGSRPGSNPGTEVGMADAWWDSRKPNRRVSIWRNHSTLAADGAGPSDDDLTLFDPAGDPGAGGSA